MTPDRIFTAALISFSLMHASLPVWSQPGAVGKPSGQVVAEPGQSSGAARAGVGYAAPGKIVDMRKVKSPQMSDMNKLKPGLPSPEELSRLADFAPGKDLRKEIVNYAEKHCKQTGPPVLQGGTVLFVDDKSLAQQLPAYVFYVLRFRMWPLAFAVPPPLKSNSIFAFDAHGKMELITEPEPLNRFFMKATTNNTSDDAQRRVALAWMSLREQLAQDGMYQFVRGEPLIQKADGVTSVEIVSKVNPQGANQGEIACKLSFTSAGEISNIEQTNSLRPGMRPICQATKLLDRDPIVRKMAEQDLLIMGRAAKPYLDYQRSRLGPALQKEIDRVWNLIEADAR